MTFILFQTLISILSPQSTADFKGVMTIYQNKHGTMETQLKADVYGKGKKLRIETKPTAKNSVSMTIITDQTPQGTYMLMPAQRLAMKSNLSKIGFEQPDCSGTQSLTACMRQQGFTKTGSETLLEKPCDIYSKQYADQKNSSHVTLWVPTTMNAMFLPFKAVMRAKASGPIETQVLLSELSEVDLAAPLFTVPSDYRTIDLGGIPGLEGLMGAPNSGQSKSK